MKVKSIRTLKGTKENPFKEELIEEFKTVYKREYLSSDGSKGVSNVIVNQDGLAVGESRFFRQKTVDNATFTKMFTSKVSFMWDMPKNATRVFSYIQTVLKPNKDSFYLDIKDVTDYAICSEVTIWRGVKWLIENEFIAKSTRTNIYFINPTIFYNGDRAAFVEIIKKEKIKDSTDEIPINTNFENQKIGKLIEPEIFTEDEQKG